MKRISDVDVVFGDWSLALDRLRNSKESPSKTRTAFASLVELSQKLTSVMRAEYPGKWEASLFPGWNAVTELFKTLRNHDQHEEIIRQTIEEVRSVTLPPEGDFPGIALGMSFHMTVDPLAEERTESGVVLETADPVTGQITGKTIGQVTNQAHHYLLTVSADSDSGKKIARLLKEIGTSDVHVLAERCDKVLKEYFAFYKSKLK